jgi:hypothetical protein
MIATVFYSITFTLPSCGLDVPTAPVPFRLAFGGFGLPSMATNFFTVNAFTKKGLQDTVEEGWNTLQYTKRSWETLTWLSEDAADALHHLVFFTSTSSVKSRRKARAVSSLQLYYDGDEYQPMKEEDKEDKDKDPRYDTYKKWSSRKLMNYLRKRLNQIEGVGKKTSSTNWSFMDYFTTAPPSNEKKKHTNRNQKMKYKWLDKYKRMNDRRDLIDTVLKIQIADECLNVMPWWLYIPSTKKSKGKRILFFWGTSVIGLLTIGIFLIQNKEVREGDATTTRTRRRMIPQNQQFGGLGMGGTNGSFSYSDLTEEQATTRTNLVNRCTEIISQHEWKEKKDDNGEEESCSLCFESMWHHRNSEKPPLSSSWNWLNKYRMKAVEPPTIQEVCQLTCGHIFHKECVNKWLVEKFRNDCPLCRAIVIDPTPVLVPFNTPVILHSN